MTVGALLLDPIVVSGSFTVPASGLQSLPLPLPTTLPRDQLLLLQCAVLPNGFGEAWLSNSTSILVPSP